MQINIPESFDTREVGNFEKLPFIEAGHHVLRVRRIKVKENRSGKPMFITEFDVLESNTMDVEAGCSVALDLTSDYGQMDCKRFVATVFGTMAAVEPYLKEEKSSAGKVIKRTPVYAKPADPNAITRNDIVLMADETSQVHQAVLGTTLKCRAERETYSPTRGANVGKQMQVTRLYWTLATPTPALAAMQADAAAHIEQLNAEFQAKLAAPVAA